MGWTGTHAIYYKNGIVDRKKECDAYWMESLNKGHFEIVKSSMIGNVYYGAIKSLLRHNGVDENGKDLYIEIPVEQQEVFAVVMLTSVDNKNYFNFNYKCMDETMIPCYYDCPVGVLNALTKTDNENALTWRRKCREHHEEKREYKNNPNNLNNLPVGAQISFTALYDTTANKKDEQIILEKVGYGNKTMWYGYGYKWPLSLIKSISGGAYEVLKAN